MAVQRILITGGAGFVGSSLALAFRRADPGCAVTVLDNLRRRGSELNLPVLKREGIDFFHGDIRVPSDLDDLPGQFDLLIEASAEPSVLAGLNGSPNYVLQTNLQGTLNCLEFARKRVGATVFLSTSRVYSIESLKSIALEEAPTRFEIALDQKLPGVSRAGVAESFPTDQARSLYGATKLASEMMVQEYVHAFGMKAIINRCGVIAGPGQFGKVDQGVFTLWVAHHFFGKPLGYTGFGGTGKQVRDLMHPLDLFELIQVQREVMERHSGERFNVGGGREISTSLAELTGLCRQATGREVPIAGNTTTSTVDIPLYISDTRKVSETFGWQPRRSVRTIVDEIAAWLKRDENSLRSIFG